MKFDFKIFKIILLSTGIINDAPSIVARCSTITSGSTVGVRSTSARRQVRAPRAAPRRAPAHPARNTRLRQEEQVRTRRQVRAPSIRVKRESCPIYEHFEKIFLTSDDSVLCRRAQVPVRRGAGGAGGRAGAGRVRAGRGLRAARGRGARAGAAGARLRLRRLH